MPKVVPSQVVALIDRAYPAAKTIPNFKVYSADAAILSAIVSLADEIPDELVTISGEDYTDLVHGLEALAHSVDFWRERGGDDPPRAIKGKSPVTVVRDALAKCPDQNPSPATTQLSFVTDAALRDSIRLDISVATSALHNGEWKAATVLAGAAVEALLLWAIQNDPKLASLNPKPSGAPETWVLADLIDVAARLNLIKGNTLAQGSLAKNFRNLIHPGRSQRLHETCDKGAALAALAAIELVVRDLT
jgi:hypothetical protein